MLVAILCKVIRAREEIETIKLPITLYIAVVLLYIGTLL
jgi:hypothetical protein